jgi:hypothetical protein
MEEDEEEKKDENKLSIMNSELIPEQNYNSNRKRFRNYGGRKRKKKQMKERPKEKDTIIKEIKRNNIRIRNKDWRYKDA